MKEDILAKLVFVAKSFPGNFTVKINHQINKTIKEDIIMLQEIENNIFLLTISKVNNNNMIKKIINNIHYMFLPEQNQNHNFAKISFTSFKNICFEYKESDIDFDNYSKQCNLCLFYDIENMINLVNNMVSSYNYVIKEILSNRVLIISDGDYDYPLALSKLISQVLLIPTSIENVIAQAMKDLGHKFMLLPHLYHSVQEVYAQYQWVVHDHNIYYINDGHKVLLDYATILEDIIYTGFASRMKDYFYKFTLAEINLGNFFPTATIRSPLYLKARPESLAKSHEGYVVVAAKEYHEEHHYIKAQNPCMDLWLKRSKRHLYRHRYQAQVMISHKNHIIALIGDHIASLALYPSLIKGVWEELNMAAPHQVKVLAVNENILIIAHHLSSLVHINDASHHALWLYRLISKDGCNPLSFYQELTLPNVGVGNFALAIIPDHFFLLLNSLKGKMSKGHHHYIMGLAFKCIKQYDLAIIEFKKALQFDPNDPEILESLGICFMEINNVAQAMPFFKKAFKLIPHEPQLANYLGVSHLESGNITEAINAFEKAVNLEPNTSEYLQNLGLTYIKAQRHDEALITLKKALQFSDNQGVIHASLAKLYLSCGHKQEAKKHAYLAYNEDPSNTLITDLLWQLMNDN